MGISKAEIRKFRSYLRHLERIVSEHSKRCCSQVSQAQCHALLQVNDLGDCTAKDLAAALNLDTSTISRTIDGLVRRKLLIREENPADRRANILHITGEGKNLCEDINADADRYFGEVLKNIPLDKRKTALKNFEVVVSSLICTEKNTKRSSSCCD